MFVENREGTAENPAEMVERLSAEQLVAVVEEYLALLFKAEPPSQDAVLENKGLHPDIALLRQLGLDPHEIVGPHYIEEELGSNLLTLLTLGRYGEAVLAKLQATLTTKQQRAIAKHDLMRKVIRGGRLASYAYIAAGTAASVITDIMTSPSQGIVITIDVQDGNRLLLQLAFTYYLWQQVDARTRTNPDIERLAIMLDLGMFAALFNSSRTRDLLMNSPEERAPSGLQALNLDSYNPVSITSEYINSFESDELLSLLQRDLLTLFLSGYRLNHLSPILNQRLHAKTANEVDELRRVATKVHQVLLDWQLEHEINGISLASLQTKRMTQIADNISKLTAQRRALAQQALESVTHHTVPSSAATALGQTQVLLPQH